MSSTGSPMVFAFNGANELWDVVASLAQTRFVDGEEPFAETLKLTGVGRAADLIPVGSVRWQVTETDSERVLARGPAWTVLVVRWRNGTAEVTVTAADPEALAKAVADVRSRGPVQEPRPDTVEVEFWYAAAARVEHVKRRVDVPAWEDISGHYPVSVRSQLGALMRLAPPAAGGRLLLWHGPPGTGKTTAIRALLRAWSGWCRALFVVDAERFLGEAGYMMSVLLGGEDHTDDEDEEDEGDGGRRWRLLVFEDADELLRADAKRESGQSLSRLLNVADGFIGQGVNVLALLTTNEPIGRLHPAVARPGRCLADVEFRALAPAEAAALLGGGTRPTGDLTLAEVFERRGEVTRVGGVRGGEPTAGQYL
jgi:hypothetical protein